MRRLNRVYEPHTAAGAWETWAAEIGRTTVSPDSHQRSSPPSDGGPPAPVEAGFGSAGESSHESIRRLWSLLQDATDRLDDVIRAATARSETVMTGRDPGRHVTASFTGTGELTDLAIDEAWAAAARELGAPLTVAITDGYAAVDRSAHEATGQWHVPRPRPDQRQPHRAASHAGHAADP